MLKAMRPKELEKKKKNPEKRECERKGEEKK